jgi:hypothetical protein
MKSWNENYIYNTKVTKKAGEGEQNRIFIDKIVKRRAREKRERLEQK